MLALAIPGAGGRAGGLPPQLSPKALGSPLPCFGVSSLFGSCLSWRGTGEGSNSQAVMGFPCLLGQAQAGPGGVRDRPICSMFADPKTPQELFPSPFLAKLVLVQVKHFVGATVRVSGSWTGSRR